MAINPGRKKKSMISTTLKQEQLSAKKDPKGAESTAKVAKAVGEAIMAFSIGGTVPLLLKKISSSVMKRLTAKEVAKLTRIKRTPGTGKIDSKKLGKAFATAARKRKAVAAKKALGKADVRSGGQVKGSSSMYMQN